jgi:predicted transcriptional regulator
MGKNGQGGGRKIELPDRLTYKKFTDHPVYDKDSAPFAEIVAHHILIERRERNGRKIKEIIKNIEESDVSFTSKDTSIMSTRGEIVSHNGELIIGNISYKDKDSFIKIFRDTLEFFHDLSGMASQIYIYMMHRTEPESTLVTIDARDIVEHFGVTKATIYKGLNELLNRHFIKKTDRSYMFHINPLFMYNGNRMTIIHQYITGDREMVIEEIENMKYYDDPKVIVEGDDEWNAASDYEEEVTFVE